MIRINKPSDPPNVLKTKGKKKTDEMKIAFEKNEKDYLDGKKKFAFDGKIYAHETVKDSLLQAQFDKCFLCESKVTHVGYGEVEHFRPKGGYQQSENEKLQPPGYYWLAYEWSNLFFSCQLCNQKFKKNLFPLKSPKKRAKSHKHDVAKEEPLFINPSEEPEQHIAFNRHIPVTHNKSEEGETTIRLLGLDRDALNRFRENFYETAKIMFNVANDINSSQKENAREWLKRAQLDSSQYASMIRCAIKNKFSL
jgi:uncharacterized protein (TIGR02646 family)